MRYSGDRKQELYLGSCYCNVQMSDQVWAQSHDEWLVSVTFQIWLMGYKKYSGYHSDIQRDILLSQTSRPLLALIWCIIALYHIFVILFIYCIHSVKEDATFLTHSWYTLDINVYPCHLSHKHFFWSLDIKVCMSQVINPLSFKGNFCPKLNQRLNMFIVVHNKYQEP